MKFIKFFHLDFRRGIHTVWKLYLCGAMLFALLCVDFWNRSRIFLDLYPGTFRSLGDLALYIFGGMRKCDIVVFALCAFLGKISGKSRIPVTDILGCVVKCVA